uniref:Uncharacterized protein n=1 Tax=Oryza punctata TaxID=4537 RepID=A0A0E0KNQ3_ORYPU
MARTVRVVKIRARMPWIPMLPFTRLRVGANHLGIHPVPFSCPFSRMALGCPPFLFALKMLLVPRP